MIGLTRESVSTEKERKVFITVGYDDFGTASYVARDHGCRFEGRILAVRVWVDAQTISLSGTHIIDKSSNVH